MTVRLFALLVLLAFTTAYAPAAFAAVSCTATTNDMDYGDVTLPAGAVTTTTVVDITCTGTGSDRGDDVRLCVGLETPLSPRRMTTGGEFISHRLYRDAAYSEEINYTNVNPERVVTMPNSRTFTTQLAIYGRLQGNSAGAGPGSYSELVSGAFGWSKTAPSCSTVPALQYVAFRSSARVQAACTVAANDLAFGKHSQLVASIDASTSLGVTCTVGTPYLVRMDGGTTANNVADRRMGLNGTGPAAQGVRYELRSQSADGPLWGDTAATGVAGVGSGTSQTLPVYGRVLPQAVPLPGQYEDTVTVTVQY